jgi:hypothetical protein
MGNLNNHIKEMWWQKIEAAWNEILETVLADSSLEEIQDFYERLIQIPVYTQEEKTARVNQRLGITRVVLEGDSMRGNRIEYLTPTEPVELLKLEKGFCEKGSLSWKITI